METLNTVILKKSFHIFTTLLFYAVIFLLLLFTVANLNVRQNSDIANVFGSGFHSIQSESNLGEENIQLVSRDIALVKILDESLVNELKVGDDVTYYDVTSRQLVTQKIMEINLESEILYFTTLDSSTMFTHEPIEANQVLAVRQSSISGLGTFLDYLQSPEGFSVFVLFPVLVMLLFESAQLYNYLLNYSKLKSEKRINKSYRRILKSLENETNRIRHDVMSNWMTEIDYEKIVKIRI